MNELRAFSPADYEEVLPWFEDVVLAEALGPLDDEWLRAVMAEEPPGQFVLTCAGKIAVLAGVAYPRERGEPMVVTDIAVRPELRGRGFGGAMLESLMAEVGSPGMPWMAWVVEGNAAAHAFFQAQGWTGAATATDGMHRYDTRSPDADAPYSTRLWAPTARDRRPSPDA